MFLAVPGAAFASGGGDSLLGGVIGGHDDHSVLGLIGSSCKEDELASVAGDSGLVSVNLAGLSDLDFPGHGLIGLFSGKEDDLVSVGGDSGLVAVGGKHFSLKDALEDSLTHPLINLATDCDPS
jgi:hypothetical protein